MEPEIRRLTIADYDEIVRVWSDAGLPYKPGGRERKDMLAKEMTRPYCAFLGLEIDGRLLGVIIANWDGRRGWLNRLAIDPDHRGKRYAGLLIEAAEQFLESQGAIVLAGLIDEENLPSMAAFARAGYSCVTEIRLWRKRKSPDA
ncbi:MAG: GNAT family N-acetyltransferase [bacterium]|nr:GNAT family N-acetyltransferase [bacterium]